MILPTIVRSVESNRSTITIELLLLQLELVEGLLQMLLAVHKSKIMMAFVGKKKKKKKSFMKKQNKFT